MTELDALRSDPCLRSRDDLQRFARGLYARSAARHRAELAVDGEAVGAHLIGLYVTTIPGLPGRFDRFNAPLLAPASLVEAEEKAREHAEAARQAFQAAAAQQGVATERRFAGGDPSYDAALHGRYADLIIVGQINPGDPKAALGKPRPGQVILPFPLPSEYAAAARVIVVPLAAPLFFSDQVFNYEPRRRGQSLNHEGTSFPATARG